jgi:hypothetical protein
MVAVAEQPLLANAVSVYNPCPDTTTVVDEPNPLLHK